MKENKWKIEENASGNQSLYLIDPVDDVRYSKALHDLKTLIEKLYGSCVKYEEEHSQLIPMNEWFQELMIENVRFNISRLFGIVNLMTYSEEGNKYILEIAAILMKQEKADTN